MTDRPILFSGPMVRALLDGRKTQTRRVLNTSESVRRPNLFDGTWSDSYVLDPGNSAWREAAYPCHPGDRLWVREAHYLTDDGHEDYAVFAEEEVDVAEHLAKIDRLPSYFSEQLLAKHRKLRPSIHLPRWASRLTLIVTGVRVQRLQDISEDDARAEGASGNAGGAWGCEGLIEDFAGIWNGLNAKRGFGWEANPWVAVIGFRTVRANIDAPEAQAA